MLEFLCELVFEFLASIFFESTAEAAESSKVPVWLRLTLVSVLCVAVISVIILACFAAYRATGIAGAVVCGGIAVFLIVLWILGCRRIIERKK